MNKFKSLLFVPAKKKMLNKISSLNADAFIIDLEDSIEIERKDQALTDTIEFLKNQNSQHNFFVRINKNFAEKELKVLDNFSNIGFVLPKFEFPEFYYEQNSSILERHFIIALIESPMGLVNIPSIVSCKWVDALAFGAEDYTALSNMKNSIHNLSYHKSMLLTYAKAYGKPSYDTPSFQLDDLVAFEDEVKSAVDLGFEGKLAINPKHINKINELFTCQDTHFIKKIIEEYEAKGNAVSVICGNVYEKMHINHMKKILMERGEL